MRCGKMNSKSTEFKINRLLKLKLENGRTNVYINNEKVLFCKNLMFTFSKKNLNSVKQLDSIDEIGEHYTQNKKYSTKFITPEQEFRGHCSNLQVWAENGYDTRLLHRNIAFRLLSRLVDAGDPLARRKFTEEIAKRFNSKIWNVCKYLLEHNYLNYLNDEEYDTLIQEYMNPQQDLSVEDIIIKAKIYESKREFVDFLFLWDDRNTNLLKNLFLAAQNTKTYVDSFYEGLQLPSKFESIYKEELNVKIMEIINNKEIKLETLVKAFFFKHLTFEDIISLCSNPKLNLLENIIKYAEEYYETVGVWFYGEFLSKIGSTLSEKFRNIFIKLIENQDSEKILQLLQDNLLENLNHKDLEFLFYDKDLNFFETILSCVSRNGYLEIYHPLISKKIIAQIQDFFLNKIKFYLGKNDLDKILSICKIGLLHLLDIEQIVSAFEEAQVDIVKIFKKAKYEYYDDVKYWIQDYQDLLEKHGIYIYLKKIFKVNNNITLKLEEDYTNIYINGELFDQCKYLLFTIPIAEIEYYDEINSIDRASELLDRSMEGERTYYDISPEEEFWGHCSNLQVWAEHNYDTRLLHRNLAFSLLKKLTEVGDTIAKNVFKEEITKRFLSGNDSVINYLIDEEYLEYLNEEEISEVLKNIEFD